MVNQTTKYELQKKQTYTTQQATERSAKLYKKPQQLSTRPRCSRLEAPNHNPLPPACSSWAAHANHATRTSKSLTRELKRAAASGGTRIGIERRRKARSEERTHIPWIRSDARSRGFSQVRDRASYYSPLLREAMRLPAVSFSFPSRSATCEARRSRPSAWWLV